METIALYYVYDETHYVDLPWGRFDVGSYYVETKCFPTAKALLRAGTEVCEEFVKENVFESQEKANEFALAQTIKKLSAVQKGKNIGPKWEPETIKPDQCIINGEEKKIK